MARLKKYDGIFQKFVLDNSSVLSENTMLTHYLSQTIKQISYGKQRVHNFFNVVDGDLQIACLHIDDEFLVYGNGYNPQMIALIDNEIDFSRFKKFTFCGTKDIIEALFEPYDFESEVLKHRIIYSCAIALDIKSQSGKLEIAQLDNLDTLLTYGLEFSKEYYGFDYKNREEMRAGIINSITSKSMYIWKDNGQIVSMLQVLNDDEHEFPFIGFFYSSPHFRGKGYGTSILHQVTKGILNSGYECVMLTADGKNNLSNKVFKKLGYKNVGEYVRIWKEKKN